MNVKNEYAGGVLRISGSLDIDSADVIREMLLNCLERRDEQAVCKRLDLSEVQSCDLCSLQILLAAQKYAASLGGRLQFDPVSTAVVDSAAALGLSIGEPDAAESR